MVETGVNSGKVAYSRMISQRLILGFCFVLLFCAFYDSVHTGLLDSFGSLMLRIAVSPIGKSRLDLKFSFVPTACIVSVDEESSLLRRICRNTNLMFTSGVLQRGIVSSDWPSDVRSSYIHVC